MSALNLYLVLVLLVILQRLWEVRLSKRNEERLFKQGAIEVGKGHFPFMVLLHTLWPLFCIGGALTAPSAPPPFLSFLFLAVFLLGQSLRVAAIATLGGRWTVRVIILPEAPPVKKGIFLYLRHPNYLGVILEIFSLPLIYGLWKTALAFSLANAIVLFIRIRKEEDGLNSRGEYEKAFGKGHRFIPRLGFRK